MYFTVEDLETIRKYINSKKGVKDSEFATQAYLLGDEWITLVGPQGNRKMKVSTMMNIFLGTDKEYLGNGIQTVDTVEELDIFANKIYGNLIFVKENDAYYSWSTKDEWQQMLKVYVGHEEPIDGDILWIDPEDNTTLETEDDDEINLIKAQIQELQRRQKVLENLVTIGIIPGDSTNAYRGDIMDGVEPEEPEKPEEETPITLYVTEDTEESEEENTEDKPDTTEYDVTVNHNCVKMDTAANFSKNRQNLVDGEMLFYTDKHRFAIYAEGLFWVVSNSGGGNNEGSGAGISMEDLQTITLDYLIFAGGDTKYKAKLNSKGKWNLTPYSPDDILVGSPVKSWKNYISGKLCMNMIYCGGAGSSEALVSHNFIELANADNKDINLKGIYLLYTDGSKTNESDTGFKWEVLPLEGIIKAGSTFVIRGAECNSSKACMIRVDDYDLEWKVNDSPIQFKQGTSSFYLCAGTSFQSLLDSNTLRNPWISTEVKVGYIDSCGFGEGAVNEGSGAFLVRSDWNKTLFIRWFMLEPAKQGNKAYASRKTTDLWTYIDLDKQTTKQGNSIQYYYSDFKKMLYQPKASSQDKNFFTTSSKFDPTKPNMVNITFGKQATDAGEGASRCFNWVSVGNYEEFLEYRKKGSPSWIRVYSYDAGDASLPSDIKKFIVFYGRLRWCTPYGEWVTSHKRIIRGLTAGTYEYRIGRDDNNAYWSDILEFTVHSDSEVVNFSFVQTSDQQGFNWAEYTAWKKAAYMIQNQNFNFVINTGDITQSGNRPSEWLDYYDGRQYLRNKEEMFTIGNNDLCGHISTELTDGEDATSKYNHINVLRYFCFELDPNNDNNFVEWDGNTYPIYSVYSFNYGAYHFISLNSEIAIASSKMYKDWEDGAYSGDRTFAEAANAKIEDWLKKDLQLWTGNDNPTNCGRCIVYMHEMPFTIVTTGFMNNASLGRVGSRLNILNSKGTYRFSRLFKQYGIRLVMGGHKHTYCVTKPVYDAPDNYIANNTVRPAADLMGEVNDATSRKPVVQVLRASDVKTNDFARYEVVSKITAPTYVMSQATGYKLVSNKEQPAGPSYEIPWLLSYYKAYNDKETPTENVRQHRPMFIRYDLTSDSIKIVIQQVENIWNVNVDKNTKSFDMNNQLADLSVRAMTLEPTSSENKAAYGINDNETETYTLTL